VKRFDIPIPTAV